MIKTRYAMSTTVRWVTYTWMVGTLTLIGVAGDPQRSKETAAVAAKSVWPWRVERGVV